MTTPNACVPKRDGLGVSTEDVARYAPEYLDLHKRITINPRFWSLERRMLFNIVEARRTVELIDPQVFNDLFGGKS